VPILRTNRISGSESGRRSRRRRRHGGRDPAVARKLAVLVRHLLTDDVDYRWAPARLTAAKIRAVELAAEAP
jgi:hypothetical protein